MANEDESLAWANTYRKKGFPVKDSYSIHAYDYLKSYIQKNRYKNYNVHQVCASSGREINYYSKFSDSIVFEASDFSESVVKDIEYHYPKLICQK
ncbi:hypothetical protein OA416_04565, partial [Paracoccaceae bacterium]|nr:hypothetical protein [Paracoccaceae bacterium]